MTTTNNQSASAKLQAPSSKLRAFAAAGLRPTTEQLHPILAARAAKAAAK